MEGRRVLADTSLFIEHLRSRDKTNTHLYRLSIYADVETSALVVAEIFYGARRLELEEQAVATLRPIPIHPFEVEMSVRMGALVRDLLKINCMVDIRDLMIASTALELGLPVATLNHSHFSRIPGLALVDLPSN